MLKTPGEGLLTVPYDGRHAIQHLKGCNVATNHSTSIDIAVCDDEGNLNILLNIDLGILPNLIMYVLLPCWCSAGVLVCWGGGGGGGGLYWSTGGVYLMKHPSAQPQRAVTCNNM